MSELIKRTLSGIIFLAVIIGAILWRSSAFGIVFSILTAVALNEYYSMIENSRASPQKLMGILIGMALFGLNYLIAFRKAEVEVLLIIIPLIFLFFLSELFSGKEHPFENIAYSLLGIFYIAVPFSLLNYLITFPMNFQYKEHSPLLLLGIFIIIWTNDTFAYITGSLFGRNRMFPTISPKKSWEGAAGGALFAMGAGFLLSFQFKILLTYEWIILALITVVFGNIGDLIESQLKRMVKVKDSGSWIPGHGGALDRFDSIIFATPFVFTYLLLLKYLG
jgi:phosphatidate cytidylyltransferase